MKKTLLIVGTCCLLAPHFACAGDESKQPPELCKLQSKCDNELQDATKSIEKHYLEKLKALLRSELDKGDVDAAVAVRDEIKKTEAEISFTGKWTSRSDGLSIINFKPTEEWTEDWNDNTHLGGHWEVDKKDGGVVVTRSDGYVLHYQINSQGHLIRDLGSIDYKMTDAQ